MLPLAGHGFTSSPLSLRMGSAANHASTWSTATCSCHRPRASAGTRCFASCPNCWERQASDGADRRLIEQPRQCRRTLGGFLGLGRGRGRKLPSVIAKPHWLRPPSLVLFDGALALTCGRGRLGGGDFGFSVCRSIPDFGWPSRHADHTHGPARRIVCASGGPFVAAA